MGEVKLSTQSKPETRADQDTSRRLSWHPSVAAVPLARGWDAEPCSVDWSGTGRIDLLVSSGGGSRRRSCWLYRPASAAEAYKPPVYDHGQHIAALDGLRCVCPIPNDRTSRFDLVALDEAGLVHLPNEGTATEPAFGPRLPHEAIAGLGSSAAEIVQMFAVDWDQDGLVDLLVGLHDLTAYWPDEPRLPPTQQVGLNQKAGHPSYDRQGLWRGRAPVGRIVWMRNVGKPGEPTFEPQGEITGEEGPLDIGQFPAPLAVSWGGRGSIELLLSDHRGLIRIYRNFGGQCPPALMEPRTLKCGGAPLVLRDDRIAMVAADIDADGRTELIYGTATGHVFCVHSGGTHHEARTPVEVLHRPLEVCLGGHASTAVCDLDGDGDLDIIFGDAAGRLQYLEDLGAGDDHRYARPVVFEAGGAPFRMEPGPDGMLMGPAAHPLGFARPAVADWLDHGRPDLIVTGAGGDVVILGNDGSATDPRFREPVPIRCEGVPLFLPPRVGPAVAPWTEPDRLCLIALDLQGFLCLYPRAGRFEVGRPVPLVDHLGRLIRLDGSFGLSGRCSIWAGPWTARGKTDLLIGLPCGNRHVVPALLGIPLDDPGALSTVLLLEHHERGFLVPRALSYRDGRPVAIGHEGCCVQGVPRVMQELSDLLVTSDDGCLHWIPRADLAW
jgi:hypothetical protein